MESIIFYIGNFGMPEVNAAGKRVFGNALILEKIGYKVILIGKRQEQPIDINPTQYSKGIVFYAFPNTNLANASAYLSYIKKIIHREGKPCIILRYGTPGLAYFDYRLAAYCRRENIKVVADVVDWLPASGNSLLFNLVKGIDTFLEKAIFNKYSDGIIAISSYLENYYKKYGCKTVVIPPVVSNYMENRTNNKSLKLVYAGVPFRLGRVVKKPSEAKDRLDLAVKAVTEAANRGVNVVLEVYGITEEQYLTAYPEHQCFLRDNNNARAVIFYGRKDMNEVQEMVNKADFTILLRDKNRATMAGFPTKVVESLSCGTPVITTKTSDLEKYINNGENGFFVDINDETQLADEMLSILSIDRDKINRMKKICFDSKQFQFIEFEADLSKFLQDL